LGSISSYSVSTADNGSLIYNTYPTSCTYSLPAYSSVPLGFTVCITNLVGIISDGTHSVTMTAGTYNKYFKCEAGLDGWYIENQNIVSYSPWATESYVNSYVSAAAAFTYAGAFTIVAGNLEQGQYVGAATTMSLSALITLNKYAASCDVNAFWSQLYGGTGGISLNVVTTYGPSIYTAPSGSGGVTYAQCGVPAGINWAAVGGFSGIQGGTFLAQNYNQIGGNNSVQGSGTVTGYNVRLSTLSVRDLEEIAARVRMEEALLSNPTSFNIYGDYFGVELNTDYSDDEHFIVWLRNNGNFNTYSATLSAGILSPLSVIVETLEQAKQAAKNTLSIAYSNTQNSGYNSDSLTALIPGSFNDLTKYIALQSYLNSKSLSSYSNFMLFNGSTTTITITQLNEVIAEVGTWETELNIQYEAYLAEIDACTTNEDCSALIFNFSQNIV